MAEGGESTTFENPAYDPDVLYDDDDDDDYDDDDNDDNDDPFSSPPPTGLS